MLYEAMGVEFEHNTFKCERRRIERAFSLNSSGKCLTTVIDVAHLVNMDSLRRLRRLFEEFPKNHNIVLVGQHNLLGALNLAVNHDIKSRVTYSVITKRLSADDMRAFLLRNFDRVGLGHNNVSQPAIDLIVRSTDGVLRRARNLALASMIWAPTMETQQG